ncbi:MAG: VWA domain-containing protein [Gemmatimonadaceae bacterium]|nr:VWA domain-containing protein [Gemmatimonadaceae bacterium]MCW5825614.1 VWA domain-containing protein [Gemmatimonadaceae bacterium]
MSFLAPWALLLAAAAAVPLLLHLLRRRTGTRVDFPAVRYLLRAEKEHAREVRLRNLLLMLVRVGIVLAVALALAQPVGPLPGFGHPPTAVAIVLDNSASTGAVGADGPALRALVRASRRVVAAAGRNDEVTLLTADGIVRFAAPSVLDAALDSLLPMDGAGDISTALRRAEAILAASALPERTTVLITDAQASTWRGVELPADAAPRRVFVPREPPPANRGIATLLVEPPYWSPRGGVRATLSGDSASWRLEVDGRTVARGRSGDGAAIVARAQSAARGWIPGVLELDADEFRADDRRFFAVHVGDAPAVSADASSQFLRGAVAALADAGRVRSGNAVLVGVAERARRPGVFFAPSNPLQLADANRALARAGIPWRYGARQSGPAPLRGSDVDGARALTWYALERVPGASVSDTLARVGAAPWAVAGDGYVLVASPADPEATDLVLRAAFVPWLDRLIAERLGSAAGVARDVGPGAMVTVPAGVDALEAPDSSRRALTAGSTVRAPLEAGVYFWRRGGARAGALVVNLEPAESDLRRLPSDSLAVLLGAESVAETPEQLARAAFTAGARRALATPLLFTALVLLLLESWLARRGHTGRDPD